MIRGLYTSGWSMLANTKKMDVISNNLANANTTAYKKDTVVFQSFPALLTNRINDTRSALNPLGNVGTMELGSDVGQIFTYYSQGQLANTDSNLDLAINDTQNAFFTIGIPGANGQINEYYTRDGAFILNTSKQLATQDGNPVLGENGPIILDDGQFIVNNEGTVIQNGRIAGRLLIRSFTDTSSLRKFGSNLMERTAQTQEQAFNGTIKQGYLEQSNVNTVKEMIDMITVMRSYEANQKILQAEDSTLEKVVNEVGAIR